MDHQNGKTILYVGGFELPDKNAAAHRVLNNAKALRALGYTVRFLGISHSETQVTKGCVQGFDYWALPYPKGNKAWLRYLSDISVLRERLEEDKSVAGVVFYNYPAACLFKALRYCKRHGLFTIADVTEWYLAEKRNPVFYVLKTLDTAWRMRRLHKKADGIIGISAYLCDYYRRHKNVVQIPPLVDLDEEKWTVPSAQAADETIRLIYAGSTSDVKDDLPTVLKSVYPFRDKLHLDIIGVEEAAVVSRFSAEEQAVFKGDHVTFYGRLSHKECVEKIKASDFQIFVRPNNLVTKAGFPTKFPESLACGAPVITNASSNIADYLEEGKNGFLVSVVTSEGIGQVLQKVASLSRDEIDGMKRYCQRATTFDYRSFIDEFDYLMRAVDTHAMR